MVELPFVEKYRPDSLDLLVGNSNVEALRAFAQTGEMPLAIILHGPPGVGKTTSVKAFVRDYYVARGLLMPTASFRDLQAGRNFQAGYEGVFSPVLYVDASVTRDVDYIRNVVMEFMRVIAPAGMVKFVIFDEADSLSFDAQHTLRSLLEKYPNTRTIYTANNIMRLDPAIQSRAAGGIFEFTKPTTEQVASHLEKIEVKEGVHLPSETLRDIAEKSESVREAVGRLGTEIIIYKAKEKLTVPTVKIAEVPLKKKWPVEKYYVMQTYLAGVAYQFHYQIESSWDYKNFSGYEEMRDFMLKGEAELPVHATRGRETVTWQPVRIMLPILKVNTKWRQQDLGYSYSLEQTIFELHWGAGNRPLWVWRISSYDEKRRKSGAINVSERDLLSGQYGFPKDAVTAEEVARFWRELEEKQPEEKKPEAPTAKSIAEDAIRELEGL